MNRSKVKVGFVSLGCSKNLMDTEVMLAKLVKAGYQIVPEDIDADIIIINTCAFIESAKKEAIDNILDIAWLKEHRKLRGIVVTGCLAERYQTEIFNLHGNAFFHGGGAFLRRGGFRNATPHARKADRQQQQQKLLHIRTRSRRCIWWADPRRKRGSRWKG